METVEGSLGVPDPQTLAVELVEQEKKLKSEGQTDKVPEDSQRKNAEDGTEQTVMSVQ